MKRVFPGFPLVVASNRDEHPERLSKLPYLWPSENIYAPQDLVRLGTWIGISQHRLFVAITNRDETPHGSGQASRGRLVVDALCESNAQAAIQRIRAALAKNSYNGFHLVIADPTEAFLLIGFAQELKIQPLEDGLHVITGYGTKTSHCERATNIEKIFAKICDREPTPDVLNKMLRFHADGRPVAAACVHDPNEWHRTVSSMIIRTDEGWSKMETWYRKGQACQHAFGRNPVSMSM